MRAGTSTSYEVLQIQNDLLEAETEELRATVDYQNALTAYRRAVGLIARPYTSSTDAEEPHGDE